MKQQTIYTVGPISGLSYDQVVERYKMLNANLKDLGYDVLCPMAGKGHLRTELEFKAHGYENSPISTNRAIIGRDRWMVGKSDIILADFTDCGDRVSIGSCMEIAWAYDTNKLVIAVMQKDNIHRHAFVIEACDTIFETMEEALAYLENLAQGTDGL
jgi:nucleoside 2-deoxyribosyltransferase